MAVLMAQAAWAQEINPQEEIMNSVSQTAQAELTAAGKSIERASQMLEEAEKSMQNVAKLRSEAAQQKKGKQKKTNKQADAMEQPIIQKQITAYKLLDEAYRTIYTTYYKDLSDRYSQCPSAKQNTVDGLMGEYEENWDQALSTLKNVPSSTDKKADPKAIAKALQRGTSIQKDAIDLQTEAYAAILGWYDKPAAEEAAPKAEEAAPPKPADKIHYKVQIAADTAPLNLEFIKANVYDTDEVINNEYTEGTYRYLVGRYNTYEEAKSAKDRMNVKGAFVVKYKNGKRQIDINEENENQ